ncbi:MAG: lytic murein transglycosylase, partial [Actinobacteria bacterium]|nr:lytic murein transglycosylase [Actinomycetota bacterium]
MRVFPRKLRAVVAAGVLTVALALPIGVAAAAENVEPTHGATLGAPVENTPLAPATEAKEEPATEAPKEEAAPEEATHKPGGETVTENSPLVPEAIRHPKLPPASGGTTAEAPTKGEEELAEAATEEEADEAAKRAGEEAGTNLPAPVLQIPSLTASACAATAVPPQLIPIYRRASAAYALGPQGPAVLAGINAVETGFGTNLGPSSAGAEGWMQFMPATWAEYGVDANGDGVADPNDPEDAIFAAARYLSAAGMPADTYGAIYAYNHADWYVSEVLANAGCYAGEIGDTAFTAAGLAPQIEVLRCEAAPGWKKQIPAEYLE